MTSSDPNQDAALAEALSEYAELLARHGVASSQARAYFERSRHIPLFVELAQECRRLEEAVRPVQPTTTAPRRNRGLLAFAVVAAVLLLAGAGFFSLYREVSEARAVADQSTAQMFAVIELGEQERARELVLLFNQAFAEAKMPRERWIAALAAPGDLPREPVDAGPEAAEGADAERSDAAEGVARAILIALKAKRHRLQDLHNDTDESVRAGVKQVQQLLDEQRRLQF